MSTQSDIQPRQYGFAHYFPRIVIRTLLTTCIAYVIVNALFFWRYISISSFVIYILLLGVGLAWQTSWLMSRRKPLTSFQQVVGAENWKYADLHGRYDDVVRSVEDLLRSMCIAGSVGPYGIPGVLVGETKATFWGWGSELLVLVESMDPIVTRVQVLSRHLLPSAVDFGKNKRLTTAFIEGLTAHYTDVSMRP
jgi:hypothetical protein